MSKKFKKSVYRCNILGQCRMCCDQSRICPIAWQCLYAPESYGYYIHESHAVCSFAFSPHSTEHSNHEAYRPRTCIPPSQKPAQRNSCMLLLTKLKFLQNRCECYIKTHWNDVTKGRPKKLGNILATKLIQHWSWYKMVYPAFIL